MTTMRLHKITLHNIASFADAEVDFDAEPLGSAPVFLITGRVGAGKSTILDAISLALFGITPRLKSTRASSVFGKFDDAGVMTPRQLLRSGCAEGRAELLFSAGGNRYRAAWIVERTRAVGVNELADLTNDHIYTGSEATSAVESVIGMNFEQLCRTTMLAQGDFARFLKSEDSEKAAILQRLVGADIYERIGQAINRRKRDADAEYKTAKALCDGLKPLRVAEVNEYKSKLRQTRARLKVLEEEAKAIASEHAWLSQLGALSSLLDKAVADDTAAREALDSEDTKDKRRMTDAYAVTATVRADRAALKRARSEIKTAEAGLSSCAGKALAMNENVFAMRRKIRDKEFAVRELDDALAAGRLRKPLYDVADTMRALAGNIAVAIRGAAECGAKTAARQKTIAEKLVPEVEKAGSVAVLAREALATADKDVADCEGQLDRAKLPELRAELKALDKRSADLNEIGRDFAEVDRLASELRILTGDADKEKSSCGRLEAQLPLLKEMHAQAAVSLESARHNREITLKGLENDVHTLRAMLVAGDTCPVCGARVGAVLPVEESIRVAVATADAAVADMQKLYDENGRKLAEAQADLRNSSVNLKRLDRDIEKHKEDSANAQKALAEKWRTVFGLGDPDKEVAECEAVKVSREVAVKNGLIAAAEVIAVRLDGLRKVQTDKRTRLSEADDKFKAANDKLTDARDELSRLKGLAEAAVANITALKHQLAEMVTDAGGELPESGEEISAYTQAICDEKTAFVMRENNLTEMQRGLETLKMQFAGAKTAMDALNTAVGGIEATGHDAASSIVADNALEAEIRELIVRVSTLKNTISGYMSESGEINARIASFKAVHPEIGEDMIVRLEELDEDALAAIAVQLRELNDRAASASGALAQCRAQLDRHCEARPARFIDLSEDGLPSLSELEARQTAIKGEIDECRSLMAETDQILRTNERTAQEYKEKKSRKKEIEGVLTNLKVLDNCFGTADGKRFRTIALSYILGSLIERANHYMETLTDRYRLSVSPGTFVILVADAYQGYRLRPTSSISGGESFMVSLSLALALSDISEVRGADILFVDEGFGSLSGQELDNAIGTLRSLHDISHRRVGIISHLPRVSESLPVQILVHRATTTSPSTLTVAVTDSAEQ